MSETVEKINQQELFEFLTNTDSLFPVPISQKTDLYTYSEKLFEKADIISYRHNYELCGVVAGYITNSQNDMAYISMVAVLPDFQGRGIGAKLVRAFVSKAKEKGKKGVHLYAVNSNIAAMKMYRKIGFQEYLVENEPKPEHAHLVYWVK